MYHQQPQYASTSNNNGNNNYGMNQNQNHAGMGTIAPHETTKQPAQANTTPLVATGDWTKDLVHLAKTAELKKHALTLQLHTAHILSAHASLDSKSKAIQDVKEQKNKLESERTRLLNCLREINEDRDKADLHEASLARECTDLRSKITVITDGDYAVAKQDVDRLRQELGQPPLPSLQSTIDEKAAQYLNQRRLDGNAQADEGHGSGQTPQQIQKRSATEAPVDGQPTPGKRPRGRPKGSKNKTKGQADGA
ncbi:hypothetical protein FIBSPDRAFT_877560 [Athelia psychrophila]|uniref:Uncharacterized protein n=1 Tax=Athelia psychrophila TaxID=1759441 RepID=A0A167VVD2_9AGAM|nr:hypothetical protein FIBSPDRAFT_877560 [Fibularhizoctonia sp. CBS 109695]